MSVRNEFGGVVWSISCFVSLIVGLLIVSRYSILWYFLIYILLFLQLWLLDQSLSCMPYIYIYALSIAAIRRIVLVVGRIVDSYHIGRLGC